MTIERDVDVVVVTFNSRRFAERISSSLSRIDRAATVTIVDNSPNGDTLDAFVAVNTPKHWAYISRPDNPGFGSAMNIGAEGGKSRFIALVNPDVLLTPTDLDALIDALESDSSIAAIGAQLITSNGAPVSSARKFPTCSSIVTGTHYDIEHAGVQTYADWICGALMVWNRVDFENLHGFDEGYFLYFEDVDICRRAGAVGRRVAIHGGVTVVHDQGQGRETSEYLRRISRQSRRSYSRKWLGWQGAISSSVADIRDVTRTLVRRLFR